MSNNNNNDNRLDVNYWSERWSQGNARWHLSQVNTALSNNLDKLYINPTTQQTINFLLPLCGKTIDMVYLNSKQYNVVGIEAVELSVKQFFEEQKDSYNNIQTNNINNNIIKYTANYKHNNTTITIYVSDILSKDLNTSLIGDIHLCFDRGSLVALSPIDREAYRNKILQLIKPVSNKQQHNYLLQCVEYNEYNKDGSDKSYSPPPHNTPETVVKQLYQAYSNDIHIINRVDESTKESARSNNFLFWHTVTYTISLGKQ